MKGIWENSSDPLHTSRRKDFIFDNPPNINLGSVSSEAEPSGGYCKHQTSATLWSGTWPPALSSFWSSTCDHRASEFKNSNDSGNSKKKLLNGRNYHESWRAALKRVMMNGGSIRRIWGFGRTWAPVSKGDIWLLGVCYQVAHGIDDSSDPTQGEGFAAFVEDFSSRIWITYRKGFFPIGDSKYSSDVNWGCMLRSSQMLVAQAFLCHKLGRSWRKSPEKPLDHIEILQLFGDAEESPCSIHNLLQAGKAYGLAPGSWVGPYAMCRTWECLRRNTDSGVLASMMVVYVVSGDEDGERGGAPVLCLEDISRHSSQYGRGQVDWAPILLMVPLVLGLEKVNPRYLPLLSATFTFPQSLGILGGRPGASTYIVGVQDEKAYYLDPHEVQQVVDIKKDDVDFDCGSYHCNVVRHIPLDSLDSSLAIGFYCRDKSDFDDFCLRAFDLIKQSDGTPLFTIAEKRRSSKPDNDYTAFRDDTTEMQDHDPVDGSKLENESNDDDWQLL